MLRFLSSFNLNAEGTSIKVGELCVRFCKGKFVANIVNSISELLYQDKANILINEIYYFFLGKCSNFEVS